MLEGMLGILLFILGLLTGCSLNNKERLKTEKKCIYLSRSCKDMEDKIKNRHKLINDLTLKSNLKDEYFKEIIQATENNPYNNEKAVLGKIKELAQTAIKLVHKAN